jgi:hypothetical protein
MQMVLTVGPCTTALYAGARRHNTGPSCTSKLAAGWASTTHAQKTERK